jgi:hypothetical protein
MIRWLALLVVLVVLAAPRVCAAGRNIPVPDRPFAAVAGKWKVEFTNGVIETCEIDKRGKASVVEPLRSSTGPVEARGGSFVMVFADDRVERWTPVGRKFVVEHWFPASQMSVAPPVLGIAEPAP